MEVWPPSCDHTPTFRKIKSQPVGMAGQGVGKILVLEGIAELSN